MNCDLQSVAASTGFYHLLKLINRIEGGKTKKYDTWGNPNSNYFSFGNLNIFKYYIKSNPDEFSISNALKSAITLDYAKMYNYFFDQHSDKITHSIISMTLSKSLEKKTNDLFFSFIKKFKKVCPSVFDTFNWDTSLLGNACQYGKIEPFYFIINLIDKKNNPSFTNVFCKAASSNSLEMCKYLIDNKFMINFVELFQQLSKVPNVISEIISFLFNNSGLEFDKVIFLPLLSPSIKNSNVNFVAFLIERGIFYDECLIDAVSVKNLDIVNIILKYNSSPKFINRGSEDGTALHLAITKDSLEILQKLLTIPSINPYMYDKNNQTPLMLAVNQMRFPMIKEIISFSGKNIVYHRESIDALLEMLFKGSPPSRSKYNYGYHNYGYHNYSFYQSNSTINDIIETLEMILNIPNIQIVFDEKNQKYFPDVCSKPNINTKIVQLLLKIVSIDVNFISISSGETALTSAIKSQRIDIIKLLINDPRTNFNLTNTNYESPLNLAVQKNNLEIVKLLLSVPSINPYLYDKNYRTSLMIAANQMNLPIINEIILFSGKNIIYHKESVDFLLETLIRAIPRNNNQNNNFYNGNMKNKKYTDEDVIETLNMLLSIDDIQMIFDEKSQIHFLNMFSNKNIDIKLIQTFINDDKFDLSSFSPKTGNTPLISVLKEERIDIAKLLINNPRTNINITNYQHESALIIAVQKQYTEIVKLLINDPRFDPIESRADYAFIISKDEISDILLSMNLFDVNCIIIDSQRSRSGWGGGSTSFKSEETALMKAARSSNLTRFEHIIKHPTFDKNKSKLNKSIDIFMNTIKKENIRDFLNVLKDNNLIDDFLKKDESFRQLLKLSGIEILKEIIEGKYGPFVISDELLKKLFHFSFSIDEYSLSSLKYFIDYDKEHNNVIDFKNEPFLFYLKKDEVLNKTTEDIVKLLVENGCDVNKPDYRMCFPLEQAIYDNNYALVHALLETHKIDFNQRITKDNESFYMYERIGDQKEKSHTETYLHLAASKSSKILKAFLELNVFDVNVKNSKNKTPLMIACKNLLEKNVKLLFTNDDLDFRCKNDKNEDALQIAQNVGKQDESDILDEPSDSLTKEQYLNALIAVINKKKFCQGSICDYDDIDVYDNEKDDAPNIRPVHRNVWGKWGK